MTFIAPIVGLIAIILGLYNSYSEYVAEKKVGVRGLLNVSSGLVIMAYGVSALALFPSILLLLVVFINTYITWKH